MDPPRLWDTFAFSQHSLFSTMVRFSVFEFPYRGTIFVSGATVHTFISISLIMYISRFRLEVIYIIHLGGSSVTALIITLYIGERPLVRCLFFHLVNLSQENMFLLLSTLVYLVLLI